MKETLKKVFDKSVLVVVGVIFGIVIVFEYIVFPGLTTADSYTNILAALIGIFSVLFVYHFIQWKDLFEFFYGKDEVAAPGETEYDYLPKDEVIKKKKSVKKKPVKKRTGDVMTPKVSSEPLIKNKK
jgi:Na+(H+)/acetate symporter ActP